MASEEGGGGRKKPTFRRTASIVANTLLAGGSPGRARARKEEEARREEEQLAEEAAKKKELESSEGTEKKAGGGLAALVKKAATTTPSSTTPAPASDPSTAAKKYELKGAPPSKSGGMSDLANKLGGAKAGGEKKKEEEAPNLAKFADKFRTAGKQRVVRKVARSAGGGGGATTGTNPSAKKTSSTKKSNQVMDTLTSQTKNWEWIVVFGAILFRLGLSAALPLALVLITFAFLIPAADGEKHFTRLGQFERRVLWASCSVLILLIMAGGGPEGAGRSPYTVMKLQRDNEALINQNDSLQRQVDDCVSSAHFVTNKQNALQRDLDAMTKEKTALIETLDEYRRIENMSTEDQYRELLNRQSQLFSTLQHQKLALVTTLENQEVTLRDMLDKKSQVNDWMDNHREDLDFAKWMEDIVPRAEELERDYDLNKETLARLNKTLAIPGPSENLSIQNYRTEVKDLHDVIKTMQLQLDSCNETANLSIDLQYRETLKRERDLFSLLERKRVDVASVVTTMEADRDEVKRKLERVGQWMMQDTAAKKDLDLNAWVRQLEPRLQELERNIKHLKFEDLTILDKAIGLRKQMCVSIKCEEIE